MGYVDCFSVSLCAETMIELPWDSEHVVECSKAQLVIEKENFSVVVTLISSLRSPTEFALVGTVDEEKPPEAAMAQSGFLAKMKSMANSAASHAVKVQRQVTASNKLASVYDVKFVVPVSVNVDFKMTGGSLIVSWRELSSSVSGQIENRQMKIANLNSKFMNVFNATREIALTKMKHEFIPKGSNGLFAWLWKYHPAQPLPVKRSMDAPSLTPESSLGKILCFTWNVAGLPPPDDSPGSVLASGNSKLKNDLMAFFKSQLDASIDVCLVCLQEATPLNAKSVMFKADNFGDLWMEFFLDCLECAWKGSSAAPWMKTAATIQVGLVIGMFARTGGSTRITSPMTSAVKTGTLGLTGNKGCVGLFSKISFSEAPPVSLSVLNLHLASGEGKADFRRNELTRVVNDSSFGDEKGIHFFDSTFAIVTGDLNSRVNNPESFPDGTEIPEDDELLARITDEKDGFLFNEHPVQFPATYKLVPGEEGRLVFADNRKPGWCDRILFRSCATKPTPGESRNPKFFCTEYKSVRNIDFSDHTPVYAIFSLGVLELTNDSVIESAPDVNSSTQFQIGENTEEEDDDDSDLYDN